MHFLSIVGILTTLAALLAYINYRWIRLPMTVGLMLQSLILAGLLVVMTALGIDLSHPAQRFVEGIDFNVLMLEGILSFLLFAGALFVNVNDLFEVKLDICVYAVIGVILSTLLVGLGFYGVGHLIGLELNWIYCFLFGALISPTDPVAVLATLKRLGISPRLNGRIAGEALFNDGIGIVIFLSLLGLVAGGAETGPVQIGMLFLRETIGGLGFGALLGWIGYRIIKSINNYEVEILITLAMVSGGYALANHLHISGPLAMVVAGLLIGSHGRRFAMSEETCEHLFRFWELIDVILNAVLFTLIGLEVLILLDRMTGNYLLAGLIAIPLVLLARLVVVGGLTQLLKLRSKVAAGSVRVIVWSGVRGGISIALVLSLPDSAQRGILLLATYMVAVFSILVQSTTIKYLVPEHLKSPPRP